MAAGHERKDYPQEIAWWRKVCPDRPYDFCLHPDCYQVLSSLPVRFRDGLAEAVSWFFDICPAVWTGQLEDEHWALLHDLLFYLHSLYGLGLLPKGNRDPGDAGVHGYHSLSTAFTLAFLCGSQSRRPAEPEEVPATEIYDPDASVPCVP